MIKTLRAALVLLAVPTTIVAGPLDEIAKIEVLPGWRTASGDHMAGLRITLAPGWKTYWRAPGDAGIPPQFSFDGSSNISMVTPHWPIPVVFDQNGMRSIGYHDSVVFPITVATTDPQTSTQISGQIDIGVCEEICIPVTLTFDATLPVTGTRDSAITAALISRPLTQVEAQVGTVTCTIAPISDGLRVTTTVDVATTGPSEVVIVEAGDANIWVSEADVTRNGRQLRATVDMVHTSGTAFSLDRSAVRITVLGRDHAIDIQGCTAG